MDDPTYEPDKDIEYSKYNYCINSLIGIFYAVSIDDSYHNGRCSYYS